MKKKENAVYLMKTDFKICINKEFLLAKSQTQK